MQSLICGENQREGEQDKKNHCRMWKISILHKLGERKGEDNMKLIRTEDAVGSVLCHDITRSFRES